MFFVGQLTSKSCCRSSFVACHYIYRGSFCRNCWWRGLPSSLLGNSHWRWSELGPYVRPVLLEVLNFQLIRILHKLLKSKTIPESSWSFQPSLQKFYNPFLSGSDDEYFCYANTGRAPYKISISHFIFQSPLTGKYYLWLAVTLIWRGR